MMEGAKKMLNTKSSHISYRLRTLLAAATLVSYSSNAEVKYSTFDKDLAKANSTAKALSSGNAANQVAAFDREQLLRCWQKGQLISNDRGWKPLDKKAISASFKNGSQDMFLYEFGETFCIYTGE